MSKKTLSPEDSVLFRETVGKVNAVKSHSVVLRSDKKLKPIPRIQQHEDLPEKIRENHEVVSAQLTAEESLSFLAPGLQKKILTKLRQGHYGADAQLDLHGLTSEQAKQEVLRFLHFCVEDGCRCVHIIHGKGYRSENNHPVLKNHLNLWLRQHNDVQAFCSAHAKDGGTGAVIVLLYLAKKYLD